MSLLVLMIIVGLIGFVSYIIWLKNKKSSIENISKETYDKDNSKSKNTKTHFCSECGAPLEEDTLFCAECGAKVKMN